jgi:hypothetical protein
VIQTFAQAAGFILTSGQYKGKAIGVVGVREEGLLYLDSRHKRSTDLDEMRALEVYLAQEMIRLDLSRLDNERD